MNSIGVITTLADDRLNVSIIFKTEYNLRLDSCNGIEYMLPRCNRSLFKVKYWYDKDSPHHIMQWQELALAIKEKWEEYHFILQWVCGSHGSRPLIQGSAWTLSIKRGTFLVSHVEGAPQYGIRDTLSEYYLPLEYHEDTLIAMCHKVITAYGELSPKIMVPVKFTIPYRKHPYLEAVLDDTGNTFTEDDIADHNYNYPIPLTGDEVRLVVCYWQSWYIKHVLIDVRVSHRELILNKLILGEKVELEDFGQYAGEDPLTISFEKDMIRIYPEYGSTIWSSESSNAKRGRAIPLKLLPQLIEVIREAQLG